VTPVDVPDAGRRARTKERNRQAILEAGRAVFAEQGYGAATVRDVIRATDLASGTFYNYFPDKEAVFRALLAESARELRRRLRRARAAEGTIEGFVEAGYRAFFAFIAEDTTMFALLRRNAGTIRALLGDPVLGAGVDELLEDLRERMAQGDLHPAFDAEYMAAAMAGVGFEVGTRMVEREPADVDGAVAFATGLFLGGIEKGTPG
jgi:AcrR family transcriptional regulator